MRNRGTTIGSMLGRTSITGSYYPADEIKILDTVTKSWISSRQIKDNNSGLVIRYAASSVTFNDGKYVCIYGGRNSEIIYTNGYIINLETVDSYLLVISQNDYFVTSRYHAHMVAISKERLVLGFGLFRFIGSLEISSIELLQLPTNEKIQSSNLEAGNSFPNLTWIIPISSVSDPDARTTSHLSNPAILSIIFSIPVIILIVFVAVAVLNRRKLNGKVQVNSGILYKTDIFRWALPQRFGETTSIQFFNFSARIILFVILLAFIFYFVLNILDSPISSTDSFENKENMTIPDIRFCYSGWMYSSNYEKGNEAFPTLHCQNLEAADRNTGCGEIVTLNRTFVTPAFPGQSYNTKCYLYKSDGVNSILTKDASTVTFSHFGVYENRAQTVYIQLYEPEKNPNRLVYFNETIDGFDIETTDKWLDSERAGNSKSEVVNQVFSVYPNSYVSLQFNIVHTLKIDPDSNWNLIGVFPKLIRTSELSISHTDVLQNRNLYNEKTGMPRGYLGEIQLSPASFNVKTITEKRDVTVVNTLGVFAGIVNMLLALHIFLFGVRPTDPLGMFQKASIRRNQKQKKEEMEKYFHIPEIESVPFITPVHQRFASIYKVNSQRNERQKMRLENSETELITKSYTEVSSDNEYLETPRSEYDLNDIGDRLAQLEGRNQILELVLKSYYIDDRIF